MGPSTRMVCADCLRSADVGSGEAADGRLVCPHCGGRVESISLGDDGAQGSEYVALEFNLVGEDDLWPQGLAIERSTVDLAAMGQIGRFQLREVIGGGAFGRVYRAYDPRLDRDVALKVLNETRPTGRHLERFFREARAAAQLDHPHIVCLHDAGRDNDRCWIAYQFVPGQSLARLCESAPLPIEKAARVVRCLADALDHAHRRGVCHRDIKPANVLIDAEGRPRLTDFGLAKRLDVHSSLTREGAIVGTPAYMSPEQAAGHANLVDPRSDIYSLGVTLYELLSGRRPVDLPSGVPAWRAIGEVRSQHPYRPPSTFNGRVPRPLDRICRRAMALDPQDRYPDAAALAADLDRWVRRPRWSPWVLGTAAIVAVLLLAGDLGVRIYGAWRAPAPTQTTQGPAEEVLTIGPGSRPPPSDKRGALPIVANRGSNVFHRPGCRYLPWMSSDRRIEFASPEAALDAGYRPCVTCEKGLPDRSDKEERRASGSDGD